MRRASPARILSSLYELIRTSIRIRIVLESFHQTLPGIRKPRRAFSRKQADMSKRMRHWGQRMIIAPECQSRNSWDLYSTIHESQQNGKPLWLQPLAAASVRNTLGEASVRTPSMEAKGVHGSKRCAANGPRQNPRVRGSSQLLKGFALEPP